MNNNIIIILIVLLIVGGALYFITYEEREEIEREEDEDVMEEGDEEVLPEEEREEEDEEDIETEVMGESDMSNLVDCLEKEGMTIYGSKTCPACAVLADSLGGYEAIDAIYVECMEEGDKCDENKETRYVPEIHIENELYEGGRSPEELAKATGCEF